MRLGIVLATGVSKGNEVEEIHNFINLGSDIETLTEHVEMRSEDE